MSRLGRRPFSALVALLLTAVTAAGTGLLAAWCLERALGVPLGDQLPGGGPWRVTTSCALLGVLVAGILVKPVTARPRTTAAAMLVLAFVVGVAGFTATCGEVSIIQFSPDRFETRTRTYHAIPIVGWRVTPEETTYQLREVGAYLEEQGLLARTSHDEARWVASRQYRWDVRGAHGSARTLERELRNPSLLAWSRANRSVACLVWTEAIRAARSGDCVRAADVLHWHGEPPWR
jgi:hypothetical protein